MLSILKTRGTILGVPIIRTIVFWGLYWGPFILGIYHIGFYKDFKLGAPGINWQSDGKEGSTKGSLRQ